MKHNGAIVPLKGVVYTPASIADEVTRVALENCREYPHRVLEPSVGEGAFLDSLVSSKISANSITAIDIDDIVIGRVRTSYEGIDAIHCDFLEYGLNRETSPFDLVIGNPPFVKRADCSVDFCKKLGDACEQTGFPEKEMKNAWAGFVVVAAELIEPDGVMALVLPEQFLTAQYGRAIQLHLVNKGFELDVFSSNLKAFSSIEQDAILLVARRVGKKSGPIRVFRVEEFSNLKPSASATVDLLEGRAASIDVKSIYLDESTTNLLRRLRRKLKSVGDYCESAAGIVTAANGRFILREDEVDELGLRPWARKILQKGSYMVAGPVLSNEDVIHLSESVPCNLVDFCADGAPPLSDEARSFIKACEESGIHERYKCQMRSPWYNIPIVDAGDGLFFKRANLFPRFCVNEASILATDAAYQVRVLDGYNVRDLCFSFYNSITLLFAEIDGRSYFSGVLELTPTEFRGLPIHLVQPTASEFASFETTFSRSRQNPEYICSACDERLCEELEISRLEMREIRDALATLRQHRRRHKNGMRVEMAEWVDDRIEVGRFGKRVRLRP